MNEKTKILFLLVLFYNTEAARQARSYSYSEAQTQNIQGSKRPASEQINSAQEQRRSNLFIQFLKGVGNRLGLRTSSAEKARMSSVAKKEGDTRTTDQDNVIKNTDGSVSVLMRNGDFRRVGNLDNTPPPVPSSSSKPITVKDSNGKVIGLQAPSAKAKEAQVGTVFKRDQVVDVKNGSGRYQLKDSNMRIPEGYQLRQTKDGFGLVENPKPKPQEKRYHSYDETSKSPSTSKKEGDIKNNIIKNSDGSTSVLMRNGEYLRVPPPIAKKPAKGTPLKGYISDRAITDLPAPVV